MKIMTLKEIQKINLEMMKDIHDFCKSNGINYSLAYGSLIGAIRHRGFIPWDDDIDIWMPRPDFERFSAEYMSKKGYILSSVYDNDTYINYTRVYDNRTIVLGPAKASSHKIGVWIDIYPIDGISDNEKESIEQFQNLRQYTVLVMNWRKYLSRKEKTGIKNRIKVIIEFVLLKLVNRGNFQLWHQKICDICKEHQFGKTKRCSSLVCVEANKKNKQEIFETIDFLSFKSVPFEDQEFCISSRSDNILKKIYGNYMEIPPKEKQVSHIKYQKFYWK